MQGSQLSLILRCLTLIRSGVYDDSCMHSTKIFEQKVSFADGEAELPSCDWRFSTNVSAHYTDVHRLPIDKIKVIAAMGDSITAALFARSTLLLPLKEYPLVSFAAGSARDVFSIGSMMKTFSDEVILHGAEDGDNGKALNVATSGGKARDLPLQAITLVANIRSRGDIDFRNDWKMVTIMIGNNDICQICEEEGSHESVIDKMIFDVQKTLDYLQNTMDRTVVNLLPSLDFRLSFDVSRHFLCNLFYRQICPCVSHVLSTATTLRIQQQYHDKLRQLVRSGRYSRNCQFAVILQPFSGSATLERTPETGKIDKKYLAPDCFHPSYLAHEVMAKMMWNNLVTPVGKKSVDGSDIQNGIKCPKFNVPYLPTAENSHLWN